MGRARGAAPRPERDELPAQEGWPPALLGGVLSGGHSDPRGAEETCTRLRRPTARQLDGHHSAFLGLTCTLIGQHLRRHMALWRAGDSSAHTLNLKAPPPTSVPVSGWNQGLRAPFTSCRKASWDLEPANPADSVGPLHHRRILGGS
ncbi:hypothetical protein GWK47_034321 [Chionoecetes opilio]|nr:hypothetical protein GWK47_034321 [Chionoecetes opilio]KAG0727592.1 hypothetical protein GWK47_034321 [Chionoecetes opilio]